MLRLTLTMLLLAPPPGPRDTCPVCGMLVAKYPAWAASVEWKGGRVEHFDGAKDLFKYLHALAKYAPGRRSEEIQAVTVTEFYGMKKIDARQSFYVVGSDVLGPMGNELVPLFTRADAEEFRRDHHGRQVLRFAEVTAEVVAKLE